MGSRLGWIIAVGFAVVIGLWLVSVFVFPSTTGPTHATLNKGRLEKLEPTKPLSLAIGQTPSGGGDAADAYARAVQWFDQHSSEIQAMKEATKKNADEPVVLTDEQLALLAPIATAVDEGAREREMHYYFRKTRKQIAVPLMPKFAVDLGNLCDAVVRVGEHYQAKKENDQAERYFRDIVILGHHAVEERARLQIVMVGFNLQMTGCEYLKALYGAWPGKEDALARVTEYYNGLNYANDNYMALWTVLTSYGPSEATGFKNSFHPGDMWNMAINHKDRAVRVEAIIRNGIVAQTTQGKNGRGDRRQAADVVKTKLSSPDEIERAAAEFASKITGNQQLINDIVSKFGVVGD